MTADETTTPAPETPINAPVPDPGTSPAKPRRVWPWVVVVVALVLGLAAVAGYFGYQQYLAAQEEQRKERVAAQAAALDAEIVKVFAAAEAIDADWRAAEGDNAEALKPLVDETTSKATSLTATVEQLRERVKSIESTTIANEYDELLSNMAYVFKGVGLRSADSEDTLTQAKQNARAEAACEKGWDLIGGSVKSCNARKYSKGMKQAQDARRQLQTAQAAFLAIKEAGGQDTEESLRWIKEVIVVARLQEELARLGSQGSIGGYNRKIDQLRAQQKKIDKLDAKPFLRDDYLADEMRGGNGSLVSSLKSASERWQKVKIAVAAGDI